MSEKTLFAELQLFAEGGAAEGAGVSAADAGQQQGDATEVFFGKPAPQAQAPAAQEEPARKETTDRKAAFRDLIKNEWKPEADEYIQKTVNGRLKTVNGQLKAANERLEKLAPTLAFLGARYNVDPNDTEALNAAVSGDKGYYAEEALERGMDPEAYLHVKRVEAENNLMHAREEARAREAQADADVKRWMSEADELSAEFPQFDLREELENEEFQGMLRQGISMRSAYIAIHNGEIYPAAMQAAAADAREKTVAAIRDNLARPTENGMNSTAAAPFKPNDPSTWTDADFKRVEEKVMRGDKVYL